MKLKFHNHFCLVFPRSGPAFHVLVLNLPVSYRINYYHPFLSA